MKVVVSAEGDDLESAVSPTFERCRTYLFVDTETMEYEASSNPYHMRTMATAGSFAGGFVGASGAEAVLARTVSGRAQSALAMAHVPVFRAPEGTVRQAVDACKAGGCLDLTPPQPGTWASWRPAS